MTGIISRRLLACLLLALLAAALYGASLVKLPILDEETDRYFSESIRSASLAYATVRGVNAVVSVAKESRLELSPTGVGVSLAAGQILDPIDDMAERLSSLLVTAIVSVGIQKIGYEIGKAVSLQLVALLLVLALPLLWRSGPASTLALQWLLKGCLLLLLLRFMLPLSAMLSDTVYESTLRPNIEAANARLSIISSGYDELSSIEQSEDAGLLSLGGAAADKARAIRQAFSRLVEQAENIIGSLVDLATAYAAMFVIQVLLLPLAMLWLLWATLKSRALAEISGQLATRLQTAPA